MILEAANKSVPKSTLERLQFWKGILAKRRARRKYTVPSPNNPVLRFLAELTQVTVPVDLRRTRPTVAVPRAAPRQARPGPVAGDVL